MAVRGCTEWEDSDQRLPPMRHTLKLAIDFEHLHCLNTLATATKMLKTKTRHYRQRATAYLLALYYENWQFSCDSPVAPTRKASNKYAFTLTTYVVGFEKFRPLHTFIRKYLSLLAFLLSYNLIFLFKKKSFVLQSGGEMAESRCFLVNRT